MNGTEITHVVIGIISARNPDGLAETLASLQNLTFTAHSAPTISILVAGLEAEGPTASIAKSHGNVTYLHEPKPGIAAARNRILDNLPDNAQLLAWIDDDTRADPEWLAELMAIRAESDAHIVLGTIEAHLPEDAPEWVRLGGFFNRRRFTDRAPLLEGVNSSLMHVQALRDSGLRFSDDSGTAGAGDAVFLRRAAKKNMPMIWTPKARTTEYIPLSRCNLGWLFGLNFRIGAMLGRSSWRIEGFVMGLKRLMEGFGEIIRSIIYIPLGLTSLPNGARCIFQFAMGLGVVLGALGYKPK